jgi:PAS domain-containing protein
MNYLTNPNVVRVAMLIGAFLFVFCFIGFGYAIVRMKHSLTAERESQLPRPLFSPDGLAFATFQQTIADLKQTQQELGIKARGETERANSAETLARTLLDSISTPAVAFTSVGLVKQANSAARQLFGFASPLSLNLNDLFEAATFVLPDSGETPSVSVIEVVRDAFRETASIRDLRIAGIGRTQVPLTLDLTIIPQNGGGILLMTPVNAGACTPEVPPCTENPSSSTIKEG